MARRPRQEPPSKTREQRIEEVQLYTPREAARILRMSTSTLANWRGGQGSGGLPFVKVGKSVRYRHQDLIAYQQSNLFHFTTEAAQS